MQNKDRHGVFFLGGMIALLATLSGCVAPRMTRETYFPGPPPRLVVEFPEGATSSTLTVMQIDGLLLVGVELPAQELTK